MFEHRSQPLLAFPLFLRRVLLHGLFATMLVTTSLGLGVVGYHIFGGLSWVDSLLNASMILSGMGQVNEVSSVSGKLFASFYALFSGIIFITTSAIVLAPVVHRLLHSLHLEDRAG
jgi:hypothetical protein